MRTHSTNVGNAMRRGKCLSLALMSLGASRLLAASPAYIGPNVGSWNSGGNWSGGLLPANGDSVSIGSFSPGRSGANISVVFNATNLSGSGLNSLTLDSVNCFSEDLVLNGSGGPLIATTETVGNNIALNYVDQSAGTNTVTSLTMGSNSGSSGSYNMAGGTLTAGVLNCGSAGTGVFNQSGGNSTVSLVQLGINSTGVGTLYLSGSAVMNAAQLYTAFGGSSNGADAVVQSGGTFNITTMGSSFIFGDGGASTYTMTAGTLNASGGTIEQFGLAASGAGTFLQSGGSNTCTTLNLGSTLLGGTGNYNLTGGTLTVSSGMTINNGTFTQTAGTATLNGSGLFLGAGTNATFNISGGTFNAGLSSIAASTTGTNVCQINQIGGNVSAGSLSISAAQYFLSGPTSTSLLNVSGNESFGGGNCFFQQSGGTNTCQQTVYINSSSAPEAYLISGGVLTAQSDGLVVSGSSGTAVFNQIGGTVNVPSGLYVGYGVNLSGNYFISGGVLSGSTVMVGQQANGYLAQSGGTVNVSQIQLGLGGTTGTYNLSGGTSNCSGAVIIGYSGPGVLNNLGGNINVSTSIYVGQNSSGIFNQQAGNTSTGAIYIGNSVSGTGACNVSGGNLNAGTLYAGYSGAGVLNVTGGTLNVTGQLAIGAVTPASLFLGNSGVINLPNSPATFQVGTIEQGSFFNQSGGTLNGYLINGGTYNLSGGTVNATVQNSTLGVVNVLNGFYYVGGIINHGTMNVYGQIGTASSSESFLNDGTINLQAGGVIATAGPLVNDGTINAAGTISSEASGITFTNYGLVSQQHSPLILEMSGGTINYGTFNFSTGQSVTLSNNISNYSTVNLGGCVIETTAGSFINSAGGIVQGGGVIQAPFSNTGTVAPGAASIDITTAWNNSGVVQLTASNSIINGGAITSTGTILGNGTVGSPINNSTGTIQAQEGTLILEGTVINPAGTITAATGSEVLITTGLGTNGGNISLTGGTYDNGGQPITNTGEISGYGIFRSGGLTNNGTITLSGTNGFTTTVNGSLTNNAGKSVDVQYNPAIFTGNVTNNGTFIVTGTTVTFAGTYTGNQYISDPSTNIFQNNVTITTGGLMTGQTADHFVFTGGVFANNGSFNNSGSINSSDPVVNAGSFIQTGSQVWNTGTSFNNSGTAYFGTDTGAGGANLAVNDLSGTIQFASIQHLASLNISSGATAQISGGGIGSRSILITPSLLVTGTLDLTSSYVDLQTTVGLSSITSLVGHGYQNGTWTGTGITSSTAASDSRHLTALGVISNNQGGTALYTAVSPFDGIAPGTGDILIKYTYYGDTNLDGKVDGSDYSRIDAAYLADKPNPTALTGWFNGDFNYDGVINGSDYTLIDNAFNTQGAQLSTEIARPTAQWIESPSTSVPEPVSLGLVIGAARMLGRRRLARIA